jgi:hypothetical protein
MMVSKLLKQTILNGKIILALVLVTNILLINCDKVITAPETIELHSNSSIFISTLPSGFSVFINNRNTGAITPDSLLFIEPGTYQIALKKNYFKDTVFSVTILQDKRLEVFVNVLDNPTFYGAIDIRSIPSQAEIFINDSSINEFTPSVIRSVVPGTYKITLKYPQHRASEFTSIVTSGNTAFYTKTLIDTSVWVDYLTSNSDLPSNNLSCVGIDNFDYKWIGSYDKGLFKFDGSQFKVFNTFNSGLPSNRILKIVIDKYNSLWVGTDKGLAIFKGNNWFVYNQTNSGLKSDEILDIEFDLEGNAWIGAYSGLYKFNGLEWKRYNDSQFSIWVNDLLINNDEIWLATAEGIVKFKNEKFEYYPDSIYNYPSSKVSAVSMDSDGKIWFCHQSIGSKRNGVSTFNGTYFTNYFAGSNANILYNIIVDNLGNKWIASTEGLIKLNHNNNITLLSTANSAINSNKTSCVAIEQNDKLWITHSTTGLNKFKFNTN